MNLILNTDSYKASHFKQYPPQTEYVSSYIESRGGLYDKTLFFGLQMFLKEYLSKPIKYEDIVEAREVFEAHGEPFYWEGWEYILNKHKGFLPLEIQAAPEGAVIPTKNVLVQVKNADAKCFWLTSYAETMLLRAIWYPTTVATLSWNIKKIIQGYLDKTSDKPMDHIGFMLNDFGSRGVSSYESSAIGGLGHLVNFIGSDNIPAIVAARKYYGASMAGFSIPAAEHSTITSWGKENEELAYANMVDQFKENKILAVVSDSYDLDNAVNLIWGTNLKQKVIESGARVVIRPDSGDPVTTCIRTVKNLIAAFGSEKNTKGFKVLPTYVRVIYGDLPNAVEDIVAICEGLIEEGIAVENICFGLGGALLQKLNRDTQKFAMKASAVRINGQWQDVFKDPKTDPGKSSKKGRLMLYKDHDGNYVTDRIENHAQYKSQELTTVYKNGRVSVDDDLTRIRERSVF